MGLNLHSFITTRSAFSQRREQLLCAEDRRCLLRLFAGCSRVEPLTLHGGFSGSLVLQVCLQARARLTGAGGFFGSLHMGFFPLEFSAQLHPTSD